MTYTVRPLEEGDIPEIIEMVRGEGFQYPVSVLRSLMALDPHGIQVAVNEAGTVIGICSVIKNGENIFFGGSFCVKKEYRSHEIGQMLLDQCLGRARKSNVGCNSHILLINLYKHNGFQVTESNWTSMEYYTSNPVSHEVLVDKLPEAVEIKPYHYTLFPCILTYDYSLVGFDRSEILDLSFQEEDSMTLVAMKDRTCVGFGSIKLGIQGVARVGPLYADEPCLGETLLKRLIIGRPQVKGVALTTFSNNLFANDWMKKLGIKLKFNLHRVYTKKRMLIETNKIYAQVDGDFMCL